MKNTSKEGVVTMKKLMGSFKTLACALAISALVLPGCGGGKSLDDVLTPENALEDVYLGQEPAMKTKVEMNAKDSTPVMSYKDENGIVTTTIKASGATYVGQDTCNAGCHEAEIYEGFNQTPHATALKRKADSIAMGSTFKGTCVYCHSLAGPVSPVYPDGPTLGVPTRNAKAPITAGSGAFGLTPVDFSAFTTAQILALADKETAFSADGTGGSGGIQCENCHGPASLHVASPNKTNILTGDQAGSASTCAVCHDAPTKHMKPNQWRRSGHAFSMYEPNTLNTDGTTKENYLHMATTNCNPCHTAEGFIDLLEREQTSSTARPWDGKSNVKWTETYTADNVAKVSHNVNCVACHDPHAKEEDGQLRVAAKDLCQKCHMGRLKIRGPLNTRGPHHNIQKRHLDGIGIIRPDGKMLWTQNGYLCQDSSNINIEATSLTSCNTARDYIETVATDIEPTMGETSCYQCHMAESTSDHLPDHTMVVKEAACTTCHAGMNAPAVVGGIQANFEEEYEKLNARYQKLVAAAVLVGSKPTAWDAVAPTSSTTWAQGSAMTKLYWNIDWNMKYLEYDGSHGFHNKEYIERGIEYTDQMLKEAGY